jgi:DNA-binding response OmpR family regulator
LAKILLVEDEQDIARLVADWLEKEQHLVEVDNAGYSAWARMNANKFDLIILDIMLPEMTGLELCSRFRKSGGQSPILLLTAKDGVEDKERGLDSGADDYLTKPFHLKELAARVRALLRRGSQNASNVIEIIDLKIDLNERRVFKSSEEVHLLPQEYRLLEFLCRHPNHIFSAEELLEHVWESGAGFMPDTVRQHIKRLRKKLDTPGTSSIIQTVYGLGYKIESH